MLSVRRLSASSRFLGSGRSLPNWWFQGGLLPPPTSLFPIPFCPPFCRLCSMLSAAILFNLMSPLPRVASSPHVRPSITTPHARPIPKHPGNSLSSLLVSISYHLAVLVLGLYVAVLSDV
ncbi:hypothetical protein VTO73DRAFT_2854 [Trametes versicolor]